MGETVPEFMDGPQGQVIMARLNMLHRTLNDCLALFLRYCCLGGDYVTVSGLQEFSVTKMTDLVVRVDINRDFLNKNFKKSNIFI